MEELKKVNPTKSSVYNLYQKCPACKCVCMYVYVCMFVCVLYVRVTTQCQCGLNLQADWIWLQQLGIAQHPYVNLHAWASKACKIPNRSKLVPVCVCTHVCACECVYVINHKVIVGSMCKHTGFGIHIQQLGTAYPQVNLHIWASKDCMIPNRSK